MTVSLRAVSGSRKSSSTSLARHLRKNVSQVHRCKPTMKTRSITHVRCPCGHRGSIIESVDDEAATDGWHFSCLRDLKHGGDYEGLDPLFADTMPACPACGQSLGPEHVVERGELMAAMPD